MKKVKDIIYEFIQLNQYSNPEYSSGIETKVIADELEMQRSNVSNILNELVKEEKLIKTNTRPVLYKLPDQMVISSESDCFANLVGEKGSLRNAIQLAKAAILYPQKSLNVLLSSKNGCGTTYFVSLMHKFALEQRVLKSNAPFVKINCRHYSKNLLISSKRSSKERFSSSGNSITTGILLLDIASFSI